MQRELSKEKTEPPRPLQNFRIVLCIFMYTDSMHVCPHVNIGLFVDVCVV